MVTVHAVSFEHVAARKPLRFNPPMVDLAHRDDAFVFQWHLVEYAFDLHDPRNSPLPEKLSDEEVRVIRRYVSKAEELAASVMLTADDGLQVSWNAAADQTTVEQKTRTAPDIETGFVAIFRQFYLSDDDASYARISRVLHEHATNAEDDLAADRLDELSRWATAIRTTRRQSLKKAVLLRSIELGENPPMSDEDLAVFPDRERPEALIDRYLYTDRIHWDSEKAKALESRPEDPIRDGGLERLDFIDGAVGLAHLYIGFAEGGGPRRGTSRCSRLLGSGRAVAESLSQTFKPMWP